MIGIGSRKHVPVNQIGGQQVGEADMLQCDTYDACKSTREDANQISSRLDRFQHLLFFTNRKDPSSFHHLPAPFYCDPQQKDPCSFHHLPAPFYCDPQQKDPCSFHHLPSASLLRRRGQGDQTNAQHSWGSHLMAAQPEVCLEPSLGRV